MFTESQHTEIRNYLLSKKLPIDILIEVNDHFISQISDFQKEKNLSFEDAFEKTKLSWSKELHLIKNFNGTKHTLPKFITEILKKEFNLTLNKTLISITITYSLILFAAILFSEVYFNLFSTILIILIFSVPFLILGINYKSFLLIKKHKNIMLTFSQNALIFFAFFPLLFFSLYNSFDKYLKYFYNYFHSTNQDIFKSFILFGILLMPLFMLFYAIFSQFKFLEQIEKIKPFLKYL